MSKNWQLIFLYGTLKRGEPNHDAFISSEDGNAEFVCEAVTVDKWRLVLETSFNIPLVINTPGSGHVSITHFVL